MNKNRTKTGRKRDRSNNKKWFDSEIKQLLQYLQEHTDFERPTAQVFYRKFLEKSPINASWDLVRWKVRYLRMTYNKAETWRRSAEAATIEANEGVSCVQNRLKQMCRFYDELHCVFGENNPENSNDIATAAKNLILNNMSISECVLDDNDEFCDEELIIKEEFENNDVQTSAAAQPLLSETPSVVTTPLSTSLRPDSQETGVKSKKTSKNNWDQLAAIQKERNELLRMKIEFEKQKFKMEFDLNEKKFAEEIKERKEKMDLKRLEIEKDERIRKLELEKQERIERFEIEMRYKYVSCNTNGQY